MRAGDWQITACTVVRKQGVLRGRARQPTRLALSLPPSFPPSLPAPLPPFLPFSPLSYFSLSRAPWCVIHGIQGARVQRFEGRIH